MIVGIGIDIVEQQRIQQGIEKFQLRFIQKLFTDAEIAYCQQYQFPIEHFAGKFAVKEAFMKAIGAGLGQQIYFKDIAVLNHASGKPYIFPQNKAATLLSQLNVSHTHISISHTKTTAIGLVVLEK